MNIPNKLKVAGMTYKVIKNYKFVEANLMGQCVHTQNLIKLGKYDTHQQEYNQQKKEECFMHEILHTIDNVYNENKSDESTIDRLSQGLYQVLNDNKIF